MPGSEGRNLIEASALLVGLDPSNKLADRSLKLSALDFLVLLQLAGARHTPAITFRSSQVGGLTGQN